MRSRGRLDRPACALQRSSSIARVPAAEPRVVRLLRRRDGHQYGRKQWHDAKRGRCQPDIAKIDILRIPKLRTVDAALFLVDDMEVDG